MRQAIVALEEALTTAEDQRNVIGVDPSVMEGFIRGIAASLNVLRAIEDDNRRGGLQ